MHVVLRRRISSRDTVDGAPDPARATRDPGERKTPQPGDDCQRASGGQTVAEMQEGQHRESDSGNEDHPGRDAPISSIDVGTGDHDAHRTAHPPRLMSERPQQSSSVDLA